MGIRHASGWAPTKTPRAGVARLRSCPLKALGEAARPLDTVTASLPMNKADRASVPVSAQSLGERLGGWGMPDIQKAVEGLQSGADVLFLLMGAVLVFAMHG